MKLELHGRTTNIRPQMVAYDAAKKRANVYVSWKSHDRVQMSLGCGFLREGLEATSLSHREITSEEMRAHFKVGGSVPVRLIASSW